MPKSFLLRRNWGEDFETEMEEIGNCKFNECTEDATTKCASETALKIFRAGTTENDKEKNNAVVFLELLESKKHKERVDVFEKDGVKIHNIGKQLVEISLTNMRKRRARNLPKKLTETRSNKKSKEEFDKSTEQDIQLNDLKTDKMRGQENSKTAGKDLVCEQCGKTFKTKYTLAIHLKMPNHTKSRPFVCGICGKGFRLSSTLCRHKIIHTKARPHHCNICTKSFNRSSTLKTHLRTHGKVKAFICDICGKGFHQKGNLRNHLLVHTGEKPFRCTKCDRAFNKMSNLKYHMHVHTDSLPFRCKNCDVSFSKRSELKKHSQSTHAKGIKRNDNSEKGSEHEKAGSR